MIELVVFGALAFAAIVVISVVASVIGAVLGLLVLPFQLFGFVLKGLGLLLVLPFLLIAGLIGAVIFGAGILALLAPLLPLVIVGALVWMLVRNRRRPVTT